MCGGLGVPVCHMGLLSPHGGEGVSVMADTFLGDTEICCPHQLFLWGSRDSLPDSLLSAIASVYESLCLQLRLNDINVLIGGN